MTPKSALLREDGRITETVKLAVHDVALDDNRMFAPALLTFHPLLIGTEDKVNETWFAGEYGNVGRSVYHIGLVLESKLSSPFNSSEKHPPSLYYCVNTKQ